MNEGGKYEKERKKEWEIVVYKEDLNEGELESKSVWCWTMMQTFSSGNSNRVARLSTRLFAKRIEASSMIPYPTVSFRHFPHHHPTQHSCRRCLANIFRWKVRDAVPLVTSSWRMATWNLTTLFAPATNSVAHVRQDSFHRDSSRDRPESRRRSHHIMINEISSKPNII